MVTTYIYTELLIWNCSEGNIPLKLKKCLINCIIMTCNITRNLEAAQKNLHSLGYELFWQWPFSKSWNFCLSCWVPRFKKLDYYLSLLLSGKGISNVLVNNYWRTRGNEMPLVRFYANCVLFSLRLVCYGNFSLANNKNKSI